MGIYDYIRDADVFFTPVGIRYKGSKFYKTFYGGLISLFAIAGITFFISSVFIGFF